jgi:hypothetical protein
VVFQHSPGAVVVAINRLAPDGPSVEVVRSGGPRCGSFATVDTTVYCRTETPNEVPTYLYSAPITGGEWKLEYRLPVAYEQPIGGDLGLDGQHLYFAEDPGAPDAAIIERASLPDGGSTEPSITKLFFGQTAPHDLVVGEAELFWLDDQGAKVAKKAGGEPRAVLGGRAIAVDPTSPTTLWIAVEGPPPSREWSIVKASGRERDDGPVAKGSCPDRRDRSRRVERLLDGERRARLPRREELRSPGALATSAVQGLAPQLEPTPPGLGLSTRESGIEVGTRSMLASAPAGGEPAATSIVSTRAFPRGRRGPRRRPESSRPTRCEPSPKGRGPVRHGADSLS